MFQSVKIFFKILLLFFVMQSTWAVAAQYCQHEQNPKVNHLGHHTHKHNTQNEDNSKSTSDERSSDSSKLSADTDCPYCHLGSIKSMVANLFGFDANVEHIVMIDIYNNYPQIVPLQPERPNWVLAV